MNTICTRNLEYNQIGCRLQPKTFQNNFCALAGTCALFGCFTTYKCSRSRFKLLFRMGKSGKTWQSEHDL